MSDSPGLVDFVIGLVIFVLNLPDRHVLFFGEIQITECLKPIQLIKKGYGLAEMTCGLVHASYSLPEWQAVKPTFSAPWPVQGTLFFTLIIILCENEILQRGWESWKFRRDGESSVLYKNGKFKEVGGSAK